MDRRAGESGATQAERRYAAYRFAVLRGRTFKLHGIKGNPYRRGSAEARCFAFGYAPRKRYGRPARAKASEGLEAGARETKTRPWSAEDLALLAVIDAQARGLVSDAEAAVYFKRPVNAVRVRRLRLRSEIRSQRSDARQQGERSP